MRKGWELKRLDELFDVKSSKRVHKADWKTEGVPFYRAREVVKLAQKGTVDNDLFISEELFLEFTKEKGAPKEGDIIISAVGTLGQCYLVKSEDKFYFKDASVLWFENISNVDTRYIEYAFKSNLVMKQVMHKSMGATVGTLTISRAKIIEIPIPKLEKQKQIVDILDQAFGAIDQAKVNIEKNIVNVKELFQSKLNDIFNQKGDGWEEKTILELCNHKSQIVGGPFGSNLKVKDYQETGIPILRLQNIGKGYFIDKNIKYVNNEKAKELDYHSFVSGDIVLAKLGIPIGKTCIIPKKFKYGIVTADVVRIRPNKENINYSFLKHFLNSQSAVQQLTDDITGATRPRVNMAEVRNLKLSVPSMKQQISLNTIIDDLEVDINKIISNYEKKNVDLEDLKKSILQRAFAGELTQKEFAL
jgi:type I restriction enzyme S subunit